MRRYRVYLLSKSLGIVVYSSSFTGTYFESVAPVYGQGWVMKSLEAEGRNFLKTKCPVEQIVRQKCLGPLVAASTSKASLEVTQLLLKRKPGEGHSIN